MITDSKKIAELPMTLDERNKIVLRIAILERLQENKSYRDIEKELWISPQTISEIKRNAHGNNYRSYYERSKTERKRKLYHHETIPKKSMSDGRRVKTKYGTIHVRY